MILDVATPAEASAAGIGLWGPTLVVGLLTAAVALVTLAANHARSRRDRQRELFADAFAAVTEYREYPFIVRRRNEEGVDRQQITRDLSVVQARLNQYSARLRVEARRVGRAYAQLVLDTRRVAGAEIARSWEVEPPGSSGPMHVRDIDLSSLDAADHAFLIEVEDHLALVPCSARRAFRTIWTRSRHPTPYAGPRSAGAPRTQVEMPQ